MITTTILKPSSCTQVRRTRTRYRCPRSADLPDDFLRLQELPHAAARFALADAGNIYGRLTNSTVDAFEQRIAALEGGVAALASLPVQQPSITFLNLASAGDNIVSAKTIYGGTYNLLEHTLPQYGITATFVDRTKGRF